MLLLQRELKDDPQFASKLRGECMLLYDGSHEGGLGKPNWGNFPQCGAKFPSEF